MIYRIDQLIESQTNPITNQIFDDSWIILMLTNSPNYQIMCGSQNGCAYTLKISRTMCDHWLLAVGDFIGFNENIHKNIILVMSESELNTATKNYASHSYHESALRTYEPNVLIHSTTMDNWTSIRREGTLKSWNQIKRMNQQKENSPIGSKLGDPPDFSDYIMLGTGITGEIIVSSKQSGHIVMNPNTAYQTGARLYFDARKLAADGLLLRDGAHLKVKDSLPLDPYLLWAATWDTIGLKSPISTPKIFSESADSTFQKFFYPNEAYSINNFKVSCQHHYDLLIDEGNDPVHDPKALKDYMNRWDGQDFINRLILTKNKSVLEIGVGTGRLAVHTAPLCGKFVGIDLSHKTIERAKKNLASMKHVTLICNDFLIHSFDESYDIIYSSLTFMHISEKEAAIQKAASLLCTGGRFVLSIDKNRSDVIDTGTRKVTIYPDTPKAILCYITAAKLTLIEQFETEAAVIFIAEKQS